MKTAAFISATLALVGAAVAAPTADAAAPKAKGFGILASRSASPIHLQPLDANGGHIWIGKQTASYCPLKPKQCPKGDTTVFAGGHNTLAMSVEVPGGQQAYIAPGGALAYTQPHSASMPSGSIVGGFSLQAVKGQSYEILNHKGGFFACPVGKDGPYKVYVGANGFDKKNCLGFTTIASNVDQVGAWEYT